ncbi:MULTISPECIES: SCO family protein [unclassified Bradyrhizobium]|uniref:SCO family protein n=1 Tax=unclassified Bradyrhizobium TaxID=2631580 RepID=UPI002479E053|nr:MULTISPECIES: SCO family protein [unclassified Bradyrhizobium]WGS21085.1 SCO family protein [Bradyrhizobium sp. ISRA463]WGS28002.1 SCO family protein [Bradyrhizobium sp. ISRA464]
MRAVDLVAANPVHASGEVTSMKIRPRLLLLALVLAAVGALTTVGALLVAPPPPKSITSGTAAIGGPFTLVSTDGKSVSDQSYRGKWLLIFFGYTFCPDACPTALTNISAALEKLGPDAGKLQPLFVTVDPQRDTPQVMAEYLKSFDPRIVGLSGTQAQIDSVLKEYRIYVARQKSEAEDGNYLVSHSAYVYLMNPQGRFVDVAQGSESGEEIAEWLRKKIAHPTG